MTQPKMIPVGEQAAAVCFEEKVDQQVNRQVHQLGQWLLSQKIKGLIEVVPAYRVLTVHYDPLFLSYNDLFTLVQKGIKELKPSDTLPKKVVEIPVCYDIEFGLDLEDLSHHTGLSIEEMIRRHTSRTYYIYMMGFLPGFPYLGGLDESLAMPRLDNPRIKIPAGSFGIADTQTGLYPIDSPGGWRIIGRTPLRVFDPKSISPIPYQAGEFIRFFSISKSEFKEIQKQVQEGTYSMQIQEEK